MLREGWPRSTSEDGFGAAKLRGDDPGERSYATAVGAVDGPRVPELLVFHEGGMTRHVLPDTGEIVIGRSRDCAVRIEHPSISRRHTVLTLGPCRALEDLGSSNGTKVGGVRIVPQVPTPIHPDSVIELGEVAIALKLGPARAAAGLPH